MAVLDKREHLLLMRRYRFVFDRWVWELPGGYAVSRCWRCSSGRRGASCRRDAPWPCRTRQRELRAEFDGASVSLALYMGAQLVRASADLTWLPAGALH
ncbi:hypothetical protein EV384_4920 [Micromonospora kangleipakensis]|uniref:NUDIX domain-containing protein n=1 Tax=Micromonospora kangleipakensis TaxID=1077942 RepID=A0A4Q8BG56_9ACTN|nr:hypothetical protein EV384_4920 [Micromonospora kangleipakensis]